MKPIKYFVLFFTIFSRTQRRVTAFQVGFKLTLIICKSGHSGNVHREKEKSVNIRVESSPFMALASFKSTDFCNQTD